MQIATLDPSCHAPVRRTLEMLCQAKCRNALQPFLQRDANLRIGKVHSSAKAAADYAVRYPPASEIHRRQVLDRTQMIDAEADGAGEWVYAKITVRSWSPMCIASSSPAPIMANEIPGRHDPEHVVFEAVVLRSEFHRRLDPELSRCCSDKIVAAIAPLDVDAVRIIEFVRQVLAVSSDAEPIGRIGDAPV